MSASEASADPAVYRRYLDALPTPAGFLYATGELEFVPAERPRNQPLPMRVAMIVNEGSDAGHATASACITTRNAYPGAPVLLARSRDSAAIRAVVINNKVANVAAKGGLGDAERVADAAATSAALKPEQVLSISTGIIGWRLPTERLVEAVARLEPGAATPRLVSEAIMTTDRYPKMAAATAGGATVLGIAKGAGMIEPNMGTMLAFIMTDAVISSSTLQRALNRVAADTFNALSIDGDQSTSDMVVAMSSGASGVELDEQTLSGLLFQVCDHLAVEIVRNGEGTAHVVDIRVEGAPTAELARNVARHIANSPLVKTAVYGNDPNVGRLLAATGHALDLHDAHKTVDTSRTEIDLFGLTVYSDGAFKLDGEIEATLSERFTSCAMDPLVRGAPQPADAVSIVVRLNSGAHSSRVRGSDLSYEYVRENADYRT